MKTPHAPHGARGAATPLRLTTMAAALALLQLAGCAGLPSLLPGRTPLAQLRDELRDEAKAEPAAAAGTAAAATAGPTSAAGPGVAGSGSAAAPSASTTPPTRPAEPPEPRFDVIVSAANAREFFLAMVTDTRYSMLMHPEVSGQISVSLKGVTVREALESVRDVYGYDFRIDGRRITVFPPTMQTRLFTVNYLNAKRVGRSEVRVSGSGAPSAAPGSGGGSSSSTSSGSGSNNTTAGTAPPDASHITTHSSSDFWPETVATLRAIVGDKDGRLVVASPHAGTIAVRAMPDELRQVDGFLRASRIAVERQVMLEAKIIEVELREGFASGIDWSYAGSRGVAGQTSGYAGNPLLNNPNGIPTLPQAFSGLVDSLAVPAGAGGTLGLALASKGFQAVMGFLQTQGDLQVLSSPRVATLNNQKAVLKVGTDEYFVTNVSGGSTTASSTGGNPTTTLPTLTLTPFFSGIALDVTPQIDEHDMITLHLRPSVTNVAEKTRQIDLGTVGNYRLPLASSSVNETDTVVRVADGHIVAIGGLMLSETTRRASGLPGSGSNAISRLLLGNQADSGRKRELVVLIRPTILRNAEDWQRSSRAAVQALEEAPRDGARDVPVRTIRLEGSSGAPATAK